MMSMATTSQAAAVTAAPGTGEQSRPTRQQRHMAMAFEHLTEVKREQSERTRTIYGGLCHSFPVLVRTCGLCQALAFVEAKVAGGGDRGRAYGLLYRHVAALLGRPEGEPLDMIRQASATDYMRHTRTILGAWIFYKRFAVSILKVGSAQDAQNEEEG